MSDQEKPRCPVCRQILFPDLLPKPVSTEPQDVRGRLDAGLKRQVQSADAKRCPQCSGDGVFGQLANGLPAMCFVCGGSGKAHGDPQAAQPTAREWLDALTIKQAQSHGLVDWPNDRQDGRIVALREALQIAEAFAAHHNAALKEQRDEFQADCVRLSQERNALGARVKELERQTRGFCVAHDADGEECPCCIGMNERAAREAAERAVALANRVIHGWQEREAKLRETLNSLLDAIRARD